MASFRTVAPFGLSLCVCVCGAGIALALAGCKSTVTLNGAGGSGAATTSSTTGSGAGGSGGGFVSSCPGAPPANGALCSDEGLDCSYGDDPIPGCRIHAFCSGAAWYVVDPACPAPPPSCGVVPPANGTVCANEGDACAYADSTICDCSSCLGGPCGLPPPTWHCSAPAPGCPPIAPNAGSACANPNMECVYGDPCSAHGADVLCDPASGEWHWQSVACPV